jgi:hypothetical protein
LLNPHGNGNVADCGWRAVQVGIVNPNGEDIFFAFELERTGLGAAKLVVDPNPSFVLVRGKDDAET